MSRIVIAIPARMGSSRFPGKVTALLAGKPVLEHVYNACKKTGLGEVVIATEAQAAVDVCAQFGARLHLRYGEKPSKGTGKAG